MLYTEVLTTQCFFSLNFIVCFWLCWVVIAAHRLSLAGVSPGLLSNRGAQASHHGDFSCCRSWALGHAGFSS